MVVRRAKCFMVKFDLLMRAMGGSQTRSSSWAGLSHGF